MTDYVKFFRETSPYINMHRGKTFVVALGGEAIRDGNFPHVVQDIALLHSLGIRIVLVHGARPQVEERLAAAGLEPRIEGHTRVTDEATLDRVKDAIGHSRIQIESLFSMGLANSPMHGSRIRAVSGNFITAKPVGVRDGIDFHHTGEVRKVDTESIRRQLDDGALVLISPLGYSTTGEAFNLTYQDVATRVAIALRAEKLVLFTEGAGLCDDSGRLIRLLSLADARDYLASLAADSPLATTLRAGYRACENGVPRSHLISYSQDGALLGELFTREGEGTLLLHDASEVIRTAAIEDIPGLLDIIAPLEEAGVLVKRSRELLETEIARFTLVVNPENLVVACAALYPFADHRAGELACVATHPDYKNQGVAGRLLAHIEQQARAAGLEELFVLTTQAAHWFLEKGFARADLEQLPAPRKALYNYQRNSKIFVKHLK